MHIGKALPALAAVLSLVGAACGDDDGAAVRETGSNSASASASGSASASASGTHTEEAECTIEGGAEGEAATEVHGELTEFAITLDKTSVPAGLVKFEVVNDGAEPHEIAIVRGEDPAALPVTADGAVDDAAIGDALIGEIEPFASGRECAGTFNLTPGTYVILCNIVEEEDGEQESHFKEGMLTTITVT